MISLPEFQSRFFDSVLFEQPDAALASVLDVPERLEIYRNNAIQLFRQTLATTYPVIERLVGQDCFRSLAYEYMQTYPSTSGDLQHFGARFIEYLGARYRDTEFAYLLDIAQLERAYEAAYSAPDAVAIDLDAFASIPERQHERLLIDMHPACHFVLSVYPILAIWQANQLDCEAFDAIDLAAGGECVVVLRSCMRVELWAVGADEGLFLSLLKAGKSLTAAVDSTLDVSPDFDPAGALSRALHMRILSGWSLAPISPSNESRN